MKVANRQRGLTLTEVLVGLAISASLLAAITPLVRSALLATDRATETLELHNDVHFAMQRMVDAVAATTRVMVPQMERSETAHSESVRMQGYTTSGFTPDGTALLAVALPHHHDRNADGFADADNDRDGRVDEDPGDDITNDGAAGLAGFDDNGDGAVDPAGAFGRTPDDDDEYLNFENEDPVNGVDDDGDGSVDEDPGADVNGDGAPGIVGVDDDLDGQVDEGDDEDDDEDGQINEDWIDTLAFFMRGDTLVEQRPSLADQNNDGRVDGRDVEQHILLTGVQGLRFARRAGRNNAAVVDIEISAARDGDGVAVTLSTTVRGQVTP